MKIVKQGLNIQLGHYVFKVYGIRVSGFIVNNSTPVRNKVCK
jgi:hypothetical protein